MADPLFDSAWLKWGQAIVHTHTLYAEIEAFRVDGRNDPLVAFRTEYHANRHGFSVIAEQIAPVPAYWRLLLGDIANNYRSALDHLAWALVGRGRTPQPFLTPRQREAVYFPIYDERAKYNAALHRKLPGVRRADLAIVRLAQPYRRGARLRPSHVLTILSGINTRDKHRTIQPIWVQPTGVDIEITDARDCLPSKRRSIGKGHPLQIGTELTFIPARKIGPNPEIDVQPRVTAEPSIGNRISIKEWGDKSGIYVFNILRSFADQPDEVGELPGISWQRVQLP